MKVFLVLFAVICVSLANVDDAKWEEFKTTYKKAYKDSEEETYRRDIYEKNVKIIEEHNQKYKSGQVTWTMGENMFTDLTADEVMKQHTGLTIPEYNKKKEEDTKEEKEKEEEKKEEKEKDDDVNSAPVAQLSSLVSIVALTIVFTRMFI